MAAELDLLENAQRPRTRWQLTEWVFAIFLVLVLVGLEPFKERDFEILAQLTSGEGDSGRQIAYLSVFVVLIGLSLKARGLRGLAVLPLSFLLVLSWLLLSSFWSQAPDITLRRAGLTAVTAISVFMAVEMLGVERSLRVLWAVLAVILVINLFSLPFIPQAMHLPGESNLELVGNWRGLHIHKNTAGPIAAFSAILFLHFALENGRRIDWLLFLAATVFTIGTRSKTAIGLLPLVIVLGACYRFSWRNSKRKLLFSGVYGGLFLFAGAVSIIFFGEQFIELISDPDVFTGRGAIWRIVMAYVETHPWLGSGYGAFWQIGIDSPVQSLARDWIQADTGSHNGYLEILVTTGAIGLAMAVIAVVLLPLRRLLSSPFPHATLLFSWILLSILLNFIETNLFQGSGAMWIVNLVAIALLYIGSRKSFGSNNNH